MDDLKALVPWRDKSNTPRRGRSTRITSSREVDRMFDDFLGRRAAGLPGGSWGTPKFSRSVRLPIEVKDEEVDARYEKGVLTLRVPKPVDMQRHPRRIEVRTA